MKKRSVILICAGCVLSAIFNMPIILSINNLGNDIGLGISFLLIIWGLFYGRVNEAVRKIRERRAGRILLRFLAGVLSLFAGLALVFLVLMISGTRGTPPAESTVIVLGCDVVGDRPGVMLEERLDHAYAYLEAHPDLKCIVCGGLMEEGDDVEAHVMYRYLNERGIEEDRLYAEDRSTSTYENLMYAKEIIEKEGLSSDLAVITSDFHEYRAGSMARSLGMNAYPVPSSTAWWLKPSYFIRECAGILYWYLFKA